MRQRLQEVSNRCPAFGFRQLNLITKAAGSRTTPLSTSSSAETSGTTTHLDSFPQTAPSYVPRFISPQTRTQRELQTRLLRSEGAKIGIVPLQPPPSSTTPTATPAASLAAARTGAISFGPNIDEAQREATKVLLGELLKEMGVVSTDIHGTRRATSKKSRRAAAIKAQQACMSKEADEWWKVDALMLTLNCANNQT